MKALSGTRLTYSFISPCEHSGVSNADSFIKKLKNMGYAQALEAAGAKVIDTKYAGSYQGTWGSIVEYNGKKGLVTGAYGSCSYCDAFEAEFGWGIECSHNPETGKYYANGWDSDEDEITKEQYDKIINDYNQRLADFGKSYLHVIQDKWDVENQLANLSKDEDNWHDSEQIELLSWAKDLL